MKKENILQNKNLLELKTTFSKLIGKHLMRGDIKDLSKENNISMNEFSNVLYKGGKNNEVIKILYTKALDNINFYEKMINEIENKENNLTNIRERLRLLIRKNLFHGDIKYVAEENNFPKGSVNNFFDNRSCSFPPDVAKAYYNKAILNQNFQKEIIKNLEKLELPINDEKSKIIKLIHQNLLYGDIVKLSKDNNIPVNQFHKVLHGDRYNAQIIEILYSKAIDNKANYKKMLDDLKADPKQEKP